MRFIDLTRLIEDGMSVYPGDSEVSLTESNQLEQDGFSNYELSINMHVGTHIDGPQHMLPSDLSIGSVPLEHFIGQGTVLDVSGHDLIDYKLSYEELIPEQCILLLYTGFDQYFGEKRYYEHHPAITLEFAEMLVRKKVKMLCLDMPSPDYDPYTVHKVLLENHIFIAENLVNVDQLFHISSFQVIALPMRIKADSAVSRIIACVN